MKIEIFYKNYNKSIPYQQMGLNKINEHPLYRIDNYRQKQLEMRFLLTDDKFGMIKQVFCKILLHILKVTEGSSHLSINIFNILTEVEIIMGFSDGFLKENISYIYTDIMYIFEQISE